MVARLSAVCAFITVLLLLSAVPLHGQITVVQTAQAQGPSVSCSMPINFVETCSPSSVPETVNLTPTKPGSALLIISDGGEYCVDNFGQTWQSVEGMGYQRPQPGSITEGITSVTCDGEAFEFFEISGVSQNPSIYENDTLDTYLWNSATVPCPAGFSPDSITIYTLGADYIAEAYPVPRPAPLLTISPATGYSGLPTISDSRSSYVNREWTNLGGGAYGWEDWWRTDLYVLSSEYHIWGQGDSGYPATFLFTPGQDPNLADGDALCSGISYKLAPQFDAETGQGLCKACAGQPINLANGNTWIQEADINLPGLGGGLLLERTWNSKWPSTQAGSQSGVFGMNWRSTYEERVYVDTYGDGNLKYSRSDGSFWSFPATGGAVIAPANGNATVAAGSNYWTISFKNGEKRLFSMTSGSLLAITDRNGNATNIAYDQANRLSTATDAAGRYLQFNYGNSSFPYQVTSVTSSVGVTTSYIYDNQGRLTTATAPDQSFVTFEYDPNSLITAVKDSNSKILELHTYDSAGRGLTSSRAGGVEALTITYP